MIARALEMAPLHCHIAQMDRKETDTAPSSPPKTTGKQDRRAEALRRNLLKRKAQARAREDDSGRSD